MTTNDASVPTRFARFADDTIEELAEMMAPEHDDCIACGLVPACAPRCTSSLLYDEEI